MEEVWVCCKPSKLEINPFVTSLWLIFVYFTYEGGCFISNKFSFYYPGRYLLIGGRFLSCPFPKCVLLTYLDLLHMKNKTFSSTYQLKFPAFLLYRILHNFTIWKFILLVPRTVKTCLIRFTN